MAHADDSKYSSRQSYPTNGMAYDELKGRQFIFSGASESKSNLKLWAFDIKDMVREWDLKGSITHLLLEEKEQILMICIGYDWHKGIHNVSDIKYKPNIMLLFLDEHTF